MAITYTNPISGLDLLKTSDDEISEMGRFIYENQKDRCYESSLDFRIETIKRYVEERPGAVLFKAYDGDTLVGFRFIMPALNSMWAKPNDGNEEAIKFRDWLVSEEVDLDAMWTGHMGLYPSYYRQGITKELTKKCGIEAKKLGLIYKIVFANPSEGFAKTTNQYLSDNPVVYSDIDFDIQYNGDNGKLGYVKL